MTLVKQHHCALIHDYIVGGKKYKRYQVVDMVLDLLKDQNKTIPELENAIDVDKKVLRNLIRYMRDANLISNTGKKRGDYFIFETPKECLLAELFGYTEKNIIKKFKTKNRKIRKVEDAPNISHSSNLRSVIYSNHYFNSVYFGDGD